MVDFLWFR